MPDDDEPMSGTELIAALQAGQSASMIALIGLLIDKGVVEPAEIIERLRHASQQASLSQGGFAAAIAVDSVLQFLEGRYPGGPTSGSGGSSEAH